MYVLKCAVFDVKPTYSHEMFIPDVQLHSTKKFFWLGVGVEGQTGGGLSPWLPSELPLTQCTCMSLAAYRQSLRQLRHSISALESFVRNHLQYQRADDVRMVNTVSLHCDSLVSRLVHTAADITDRYHVTRHGHLAVYDYDACAACDVDNDAELLLAVDLSRLLSGIRTAAQLISLTTH